jgi:hypothetical protein
MFDVLGRRVYDERLGTLSYGAHSYEFAGRDRFGALLPSGVYFYSISATGLTKFGKLVVTR